MVLFLESLFSLIFEADFSWTFVGRRERHARHFRQPAGQLLLDSSFSFPPFKQTLSSRTPSRSLRCASGEFIGILPGLRSFVDSAARPFSCRNRTHTTPSFLSLYPQVTLVPARNLAPFFRLTLRHRKLGTLLSSFAPVARPVLFSWPRRTISSAPSLQVTSTLLRCLHFLFALILKAFSLGSSRGSWSKVGRANSPSPLPTSPLSSLLPFCPSCSLLQQENVLRKIVTRRPFRFGPWVLHRVLLCGEAFVQNVPLFPPAGVSGSRTKES